jgi:hypothetical protein
LFFGYRFKQIPALIEGQRSPSRVTFPLGNGLEGGSGKAPRFVAADDQSAAIRLFRF